MAFDPRSGSWLIGAAARIIGTWRDADKSPFSLSHLAGEQPSVGVFGDGGHVCGPRPRRVGYDRTGNANGQLPSFIDYLKQGGLFEAWVADCPLSLASPNALKKRDLLGTVMLSVLSGHRRYTQVTALRCDLVNPPLLGIRKVVSEDAVRRGLAKNRRIQGP